MLRTALAAPMGLKLVVDRITFRFGCLAAAERFSYLKGRLKRFEIERGAGVDGYAHRQGSIWSLPKPQ